MAEFEVVKQKRHQLIFLVGDLSKIDFPRISEELGIAYINVNLELSKKLLEIPINKRPRKVAALFNEMLDEYDAPIFLLDHIDVLFEPSLKLNPGNLLESLSRSYIFVIPWYGKWTDSELVYAEPGYPEYFRYPHNEVTIISI